MGKTLLEEETLEDDGKTKVGFKCGGKVAPRDKDWW